jgi:radical SAM superfamily enzyme YgiQ (UPF0313 family)
MNILLVQPRPRGALWLGNLTCFEPLGLETIAAPLQKEHKLKLVDFFKFNELRSTLSSFKPDICAISCSFTMDVNITLKVAEFVKRSKISPFVVVGGHHASLYPSDFQKDFIDAVVIGEGEVTLAELVSCLERNDDLMTVTGLALNRDGQQFFSGPRSLIGNLDSLPLPARHLSKRFRKQYFCQFQRPIAIVETTRGCPYRCNFCSVHKFYGDKVRFKSPERVVQELASIKEEAIFFSDDNFLASISRAERIASLLRENKIKKQYNIQARSDSIAKHPEIVRLWKEVGLTSVLIGFEKIDDEGLDCLNKRNTVESNEEALRILYSLGLGLAPSFIVDPDESHEGFAKLLQYVNKLQIKTPVFTVLTPFPGTDLFTQVKEKITTKNYDLFDCYHAVLPTRLPLADFYREFSKLYADTLQSYAHSRIDITGALRRIGRGKLSPFHLRKLMKAVGMLANPDCYLAGHQSVVGKA